MAWPAGDATAWHLHGFRAGVAQLLAVIPPIVSLGTPLLWAASNLDQLQTSWNDDLISLSGRSLLLALVAAVLAVTAALVLAIAKRWSSAPWLKSLTFLAERNPGYAIPGTVAAGHRQTLVQRPSSGPGYAIASRAHPSPGRSPPCSCCCGATAIDFWRWRKEAWMQPWNGSARASMRRRRGWDHRGSACSNGCICLSCADRSPSDCCWCSWTR